MAISLTNLVSSSLKCLTLSVLLYGCANKGLMQMPGSDGELLFPLGHNYYCDENSAMWLYYAREISNGSLVRLQNGVYLNTNNSLLNDGVVIGNFSNSSFPDTTYFSKRVLQQIDTSKPKNLITITEATNFYDSVVSQIKSDDQTSIE